MKRIAVIVPEQAVLSSIWDTKRLFLYANQLLKGKEKDDPFEIRLVGFNKQMLLEGGSCTIEVDHTLEDAGFADLVIVPAISGDVIRGTQLNRHYFPWLAEQYHKGAEIASYCVGAFIVASTGLLNGKYCSTHWAYADEMSAYYPEIKVVHDKIITEQQGIYSSGGGTSYWNLLLYLLEKFTSRQTVIAAAKYFLLDIARDSQSDFIMFKGQKEHGDKLIENIQVYIEHHFRERIDIAKMAADFSVVRRTLERRFKKATRNTVAEYIQRIKIEAAKKEIEMGRNTINEIMYGLDYTDKRAFKDLFLKITGLTPMAYKRKYVRD